MSRFENCPGNQSIMLTIHLENSSVSANKLFYSGYFSVPEIVTGPLELATDINQCDTSMKQCNRYPSIRVPAMCQKFKDKKAFYYESIINIVPTIECPVKAQNYIINNSSIDLSAHAFIPLSESLWILTSKIFSGKNRKLIICVETEFKIVRDNGRKRPVKKDERH